MPRILSLLIVSVLLGQLAAAELTITGKWMVSGFASTPSATKGASVVHCRPGAMTIEIGEGSMTTTLAMMPGTQPQVMTYTVQQRTATSVTILVAGLRDQAPTATVISQDGTGLILTDDKTVTTVVPYDAAAVAVEQQRIDEAAKPADPLKDQALSGHLDGADWTPTACRRSSTQFDGDRIRVKVTADAPGAATGALPSLIIALPTTPGEYPLNRTFTITVVTPPTRNAVLSNGTLVVYQASDTAIAFGLTARGLDGTLLNGKLTADVSPLK